MENYHLIAEQLLGRKLNSADGYTFEEIQQAENLLGLTIPEPLKRFYSLVGKVDTLTSSFQRFLPLDELQAEGDKIIFLAENQEVCLWSTTSVGDTVWVRYNENDAWMAEPTGLSEFIKLIMYYNCAQGGYEFGGMAYKENYATILAYVQKSWEKVVRYNGLIIYAYQDNLIWYFYKDTDMPTDDGIYLSCRTEEGFEELLDRFEFVEL